MNNINERRKIFLNKLKNIHQNNIIILDENQYIKNNIKIEVKCKICNHIWSVLPMQLTRTNKPTGCPNCSNNLKKTTESFKEFIYNLVKDEYIVVGEYINSSTLIKMKHMICEREYYVRPNDFQQGYRCPHCSHGHKLKTQTEFEREIFDLVGNEYSIQSKYLGCSKKILLKHNSCNNYWEITPRNFLSNNCRCPYCSNNLNSKGYLTIKNYLDLNNIEYEREKTFNDLKYKKSLKIDFYIKNINLCIEFDGDQHFKGWYDKNDLLITRKRDILKNEYCIKNNINLLRIDNSNLDNIEYILNEIINKRSTTIESYNIFYIESGKIKINNHKYEIIN